MNENETPTEKTSPKGNMDIKVNAQREEIDIPVAKHSWLIRILVAVVVFLLVAGAGVAWIWWSQNGSTTSSSNNTVTSTTTNTSVSNTTNATGSTNTANTAATNTTNAAKANAEAAALLDEVKTAPSVNDSYEPLQATSTFAPDAEKIYVTLKTKNLTETKQVKVVWEYSEDGTFIDDVVYAAEEGINRIAFHLEKPTSGSWPLGSYKVSIYIDGVLAKSLNFSVKEVSAPDKTVDTPS